MVDDDVFEQLNAYNWIAQPTGTAFYAARRGRVSLGENRRKILLMHRLIINAKPEEFVDHINRNPLDNQRENLRIVTQRQNALNSSSSKRTRIGSSKGVCYVPELNKTNPWLAYYSKDRRRKYLGYFPTEEAARIVFEKAAREEYGEFFCDAVNRTVPQ